MKNIIKVVTNLGVITSLVVGTFFALLAIASFSIENENAVIANPGYLFAFCAICLYVVAVVTATDAYNE